MSAYQRAYDLAEAHGDNAYDKARALRGMGYSLIDLKKLDEATALFENSLTLEPGNQIALNEIDYIKMLKIRDKAESGDAAAQFKLGWLYTTGTILPKNYTEGVKWYRLAAEQGDVNAETCLGFAYLTGNGVERSETEAVKWSRLAAEQGDAFAQCNIGLAYAKGLGVEKNSVEAVKWFLLSANQGMAEAQSNLGNAYSKGEGVKLNKATAKAWYQKACANGYQPACDVLKKN